MNYKHKGEYITEEFLLALREAIKKASEKK